MKITIIRSARKTLAIHIKNPDEIIVRSPKNFPLTEIQKILEKKRHWVEKVREKIAKTPRKHYSCKEKNQIKKELKKYICERTENLWKKNAFLPPYTNISITSAETRWGSCSSKNSLNFSYQLWEFLPENPDFIDSVIVHELAHLKEKNHQKDFWNLVFLMMPNYREIQNQQKKAQ